MFPAPTDRGCRTFVSQPRDTSAGLALFLCMKIRMKLQFATSEMYTSPWKPPIEEHSSAHSLCTWWNSSLIFVIDSIKDKRDGKLGPRTPQQHAQLDVQVALQGWAAFCWLCTAPQKLSPPGCEHVQVNN